ncbi:hypothetical protein BsWGS_15513 [Bradybaena similaris]
MNNRPATRCLEPDQETEIVWISSRLPQGPKPVPRFKHRLPKLLEPLQEHDKHWLPVSDPALASFLRATSKGPRLFYRSHPATRCEQWSTLMQMVPSHGFTNKDKPKRWGIASSAPQSSLATVPERLPLVNSCMTTFVDEAHVIDRSFKLYTSS